jgi:hypothetical protein
MANKTSRRLLTHALVCIVACASAPPLAWADKDAGSAPNGGSRLFDEANGDAPDPPRRSSPADEPATPADGPAGERPPTMDPEPGSGAVPQSEPDAPEMPDAPEGAAAVEPAPAPVPPAAAQERALKVIKDVFAEDYRKRPAADRLALAQRFCRRPRRRSTPRPDTSCCAKRVTSRSAPRMSPQR